MTYTGQISWQRQFCDTLENEVCEPKYLIKDLVHEFETPASATFRTDNATHPKYFQDNATPGNSLPSGPRGIRVGMARSPG